MGKIIWPRVVWYDCQRQLSLSAAVGPASLGQLFTGQEHAAERRDQERCNLVGSTAQLQGPEAQADNLRRRGVPAWLPRILGPVVIYWQPSGFSSE